VPDRPSPAERWRRLDDRLRRWLGGRRRGADRGPGGGRGWRRVDDGLRRGLGSVGAGWRWIDDRLRSLPGRLRRLDRRWRDAWRRARGRTLAWLLRLLVRLLRKRSRETVQAVGRALGELAWLFGMRDRGRALAHLAMALPEVPRKERRRIARACFLHQGTNLAEDLHLVTGSCFEAEVWTDVEGWEEVQELRKAGRPIMILTGHCGNWELLAAVINCRELEMSVVARRLDEPELQELLLELRRRFGTATIERGEAGSARRLLQVFRDGGALGMLIDQDIRVDGVWVPFFGRPAYTPVGAAKIALRQGAAVVPAFIERRPGGRHLARFLPPLDLPADPEAATALMTAAIEEQVRRVPEQWVWMHRRWRRRPPAAEEG
jgi:KDO2-lipid IV(A) lauroyltransferase